MRNYTASGFKKRINGSSHFFSLQNLKILCPWWIWNYLSHISCSHFIYIFVPLFYLLLE